jgi:hypothetical protein
MDYKLPICVYKIVWATSIPLYDFTSFLNSEQARTIVAVASSSRSLNCLVTKDQVSESYADVYGACNFSRPALNTKDCSDPVYIRFMPLLI